MAKFLNTSATKLEKAVKLKYLEPTDKGHHVSDAGKKAGVEFKKGRFGYYFLFPTDMTLGLK